MTSYGLVAATSAIHAEGESRRQVYLHLVLRYSRRHDQSPQISRRPPQLPRTTHYTSRSRDAVLSRKGSTLFSCITNCTPDDLQVSRARAARECPGTSCGVHRSLQKRSIAKTCGQEVKKTFQTLESRWAQSALIHARPLGLSDHYLDY